MVRGMPRLIKWKGFIDCEILLIFILLASSFAAIPGCASAIDLALIEPAELSRNMQAWAILDARPRSEWQTGHIPGAHSFSWDNYTRTDENGIPYRVWQPQDLADSLNGMGITEDTPIAVYGDADTSWGGEGWACWVFSWLGHKGPVRLMAGGVQSWKRQGYSMKTESEEKQPAPVRYQFHLQPELDITTSELEEKGASLVRIDTRSTMEWLTGRLPGAIHIPWTSFYTGKDHHPIDAASLRKLLQAHGVDPNRPLVYYCAGGVRSAYAWTVHVISGLLPAFNYEGGMEDWKRRTDK